MRRVFLLAVALLVVTGCSGGAREHRSPRMSARARAYLTTALDDLQQRALNRKRIGWTTVRRQAEQRAAGAKTPADTYPAIELALAKLDVHGHSMFLTRSQYFAQKSTPISAADLPTGSMLGHDVGYLMLPAMTKNAAAARYPAIAQRILATEDAAGACGWIVDLRDNLGGNFNPMVEGAAPLLGAGTVGAFIDPDGHQTPWTISAAGFAVGGKVESAVRTSYRLKHPDAPVAVLTGGATASSAEATLIAFHGRPDTQFFGQPTYGVPTGNAVIPLSDGARLVLTETQEADRTGHVYPDAPIRPNHAVYDPHENAPGLASTRDADDPVMHAAISWLLQQHTCQH
jgi:carboxyl-terminal processing protease